MAGVKLTAKWQLDAALLSRPVDLANLERFSRRYWVLNARRGVQIVVDGFEIWLGSEKLLPGLKKPYNIL